MRVERTDPGGGRKRVAQLEPWASVELVMGWEKAFGWEFFEAEEYCAGGFCLGMAPNRPAPCG